MHSARVHHFIEGLNFFPPQSLAESFPTANFRFQRLSVRWNSPSQGLHPHKRGQRIVIDCERHAESPKLRMIF
jgi:hypothetical protein